MLKTLNTQNINAMEYVNTQWAQWHRKPTWAWPKCCITHAQKSLGTIGWCQVPSGVSYNLELSAEFDTLWCCCGRYALQMGMREAYSPFTTTSVALYSDILLLQFWQTQNDAGRVLRVEYNVLSMKANIIILE